MDLHQERYLQLVHRLEGLLARHWPELPTHLELTSSSLMALLARIGGPAYAIDDQTAIKVANGKYVVKLHFAETFEVLIESYNNGSRNIEELFEELLK